MATGDVVGWLNADDWYLPGCLDAVSAAFIDHPKAEWLTGRCPIVNELGERIRTPVTTYKNALLRAYSFPLYLTQNFISCPATFVRREAYAEVGLFDLGYQYSMDYDMFLRLARRGNPVVLHRDLAVFTMTEGTKSMSGFEEQFKEHRLQSMNHGGDHPIAVSVNRLATTAITATYRGLRSIRERRA